MTSGEFIEATSRLEQYFGKEYTNEQRQIMFDELQNLSVERYKQLVSVVIRKNKFLPKVADFEEASIETPYINKQKTDKIECNKCNSTGYLQYTKKIKNGDSYIEYTYACLCNCENAKRYEGWNVSDTRYRSKFYIPYAKELNLVN